MTPEQLDMHKRLQPLYKRVMGEWNLGDFGYSEIVESVCYCISDWPVKTFAFYTGSRLIDCLQIIRIPLTIDSEHPERGLWGMLHNESWVIESFDTLDKITVKLRYPRRRFQVTNDPTTAILKALCVQEEL